MRNLDPSFGGMEGSVAAPALAVRADDGHHQPDNDQEEHENREVPGLDHQCHSIMLIGFDGGAETLTTFMNGCRPVTGG
jgi:hypothetical protein